MSRGASVADRTRSTRAILFHRFGQLSWDLKKRPSSQDRSQIISMVEELGRDGLQTIEHHWH